MTKKAQTTASETPTGPELTTAATLSTEFKMSNDTVVKCLRDAGVVVVSTMTSGKRNFAFYDKAKATEAIKLKIAEKERIARERQEAKEALQKRREEKAVSAAPGDKTFVSAPVLDPNFNVAAIAEAVKHAVAKNFDVLAEAIEHQSNALAVVVAERKEQDVTQFTLLHDHLARMTNRIDNLASVVASLEETLLAIHTAPSPPALEPAPTPAPSPEPVQVETKIGEASKEQQFFREGNETATGQQVVEAQSEKTDQGHVSGSGGKNASGVRKAWSGDDSKSHPIVDSGTGTGKSRTKPRVLIVGLHDNKVRHVESFRGSLDMTIVNPDQATMKGNKTLPTTDYIVLMRGFVSHAGIANPSAGPGTIKLKGGLTTLRAELQAIVDRHQAA